MSERTQRIIVGAVVGAVVAVAAYSLLGGETGVRSLLGEDCIKNAYGAEFCGEEAVQMCREYGGPACAEITGDTKGRVGRELDRETQELETGVEQFEPYEPPPPPPDGEGGFSP